MLSTLAIIGIFTEIFTSGILLAGCSAFIKRFFSFRKLKDLLFSFIFLALFIYVGSTIASQLMFNLGRELWELIVIQKIMSVSIVLCALLIWVFVLERFSIKRLSWSIVPLGLLSGLFIYRILASSLNLIYREGIIEPIVAFSLAVPVKPFMAFMLLILAMTAFVVARKSKEGQYTLTRLLAWAAMLFLLAMFCSWLYVRFGEAGYLLVSWLIMLFAILAFLLAELIPPDAAEASHPLQYFRTRILFKLTLIFVLLIVILFEATTLATINISKDALSKAIISNYYRLASSVAAEIEGSSAKPGFEALQKYVSIAKINGRGLAYVVDLHGRVVSHPDAKRALQQENLKGNQAVSWVVAGESGGGEFRDELGALMVGAYVPIPQFGWGVVVQEPINSAYFEIRRLETNSLLFVIAGIIMTAFVGVFFARSIERPIKALTNGTEAVAKGDLYWESEVQSVDEIGRLTSAFNKMTKDLRDSQERLVLSEKLASLGTMAAGMAHEIKNPLVSLRTFTQLLDQKWEDAEFRKKFSSIIPQEIERINRIAESLLKFGKPMKPELAHVDINGLLEEVLMLFESESKKNNVRVTTTLAELPPIVGDAGQLQQAFVNIIKNGIESMENMGGELVVKTDIGEVVRLGKLQQRHGIKRGEEMVWGEEEELEKPKPVVFIEISDSGEGIPEENLKSLFDPFFTTKMTGTGMGLPITLRIIEEHKGSVKVKSQAKKGTTFIITLPQTKL
ncbi:MAG: ATP-binding protein [bacterium]